MTQQQREKLFEIMGRIDGLCWGVENRQISEGFCGVVEDLAKLLEEDAEDDGETEEDDVPLISMEGYK